MLLLLANTVRTNTKEQIKLHSFPSRCVSFAKNKNIVVIFGPLRTESLFLKLVEDS